MNTVKDEKRDAKSPLGRGLASLIPTTKSKVIEGISEQRKINNEVLSTSEISVKIDDIEANSNQPRKDFREEELHELSDSIKEHGIIQPIIVRKVVGKSKYQIIAGERRWRAARIAGLSDIPIISKDIDESKMMEVSIIENIQRHDLNPIEESESYTNLISSFNYTQYQLSKKLGKSRSYIANMLRLAQLPSEIKEMVISGDITTGHAKVLLNCDDAVEIAQIVCDKKLSVRATEDLIKHWNKAEKKHSETSLSKGSMKDPDTIQIEEMLAENLGMKVSVLNPDHKKGKVGSIKIDFHDEMGLEKIVQLLSDDKLNF